MNSSLYHQWLEYPSMPEELAAELRSMDSDTITDSFYRCLSFGTGGLRGVIGAGTNRMNVYTVAQATRGLSQYLLGKYDNPSVAVSYDSRIHSRDFAELAAAVLAEAGIHVWIYRCLQPTPMLSFAVRYHAASAGIMITASHNPAIYNGYKVYGADGCQITLEAAEQIQGHINSQPVLYDPLPSFDYHLSCGNISWIQEETLEAYYRSIIKLRMGSCPEPLHVVYSPLNGTGNIPVREILRRLGNIQVSVVKDQELPDGRFPTCPYPNPEIRQAMDLAIRQTIEEKADLCFATDPDCDRMGAGVRQGSQVVLISGNDMGVLMLDYLCRKKAFRSSLPGVVVKTIVSTDMAAAICARYKLELRNVLTGFKYIGEQIGLLEKNGETDRFLFGFEESYGYLSGTDVRDKDAVNAALLLCEMASELKSRGLTLLNRLEELRDEYGYFSQRLLTYEYQGENGSRRMASIMKELRKPLEEFTSPLLQQAERTDYLSGSTGLPKSDVLSFSMQDGLRLVVRPSGTEPKLKAYLFSHASDAQASEAALDRLQQLVDQICG